MCDTYKNLTTLKCICEHPIYDGDSKCSKCGTLLSEILLKRRALTPCTAIPIVDIRTPTEQQRCLNEVNFLIGKIMGMLSTIDAVDNAIYIAGYVEKFIYKEY